MTQRTETELHRLLEGLIDNPVNLAIAVDGIKAIVERDSYFGRLLKFHKNMKQHIGEKFELPPQQVIELRLNLMIEEFSETVKGMGSEAYSSYGRKLFHKSQTIHYEVEKAREKMVFNPIEVRDGFADTMVVLVGAMVAFGLHNDNLADEDFQEVMDSNDSKSCKSKKEAIATQEMYRAKGEDSKIEKQESGEYLVFRIPDKKLLKSINYTPANFNR